jgi:hypothetical protein
MKVKAWLPGGPALLGLGPKLSGVLFTGEDAIPGFGWDGGAGCAADRASHASTPDQPSWPGRKLVKTGPFG